MPAVNLLVSLAALAGTGVPPTEVDIRAFQYQPATLTVEAGATVRWTNRDAVGHTVTEIRPEGSGRLFDRALADSGAAVEISFPAPGRYRYRCERHEFMTGEIIVTRSPSTQRGQA